MFLSFRCCRKQIEFYFFASFWISFFRNVVGLEHGMLICVYGVAAKKWKSKSEIRFLFSFFFIWETHTHIWGKGDEIKEYTHTPTPKLHATVSVFFDNTEWDDSTTLSMTRQMINPFSISHLTDVRWLDNTEYLFLFEKHTHTHIWGKGMR